MAERRVPMGRASGWSDEDLDELTRVTLEEMEEARRFWADQAGRRWRQLLDQPGQATWLQQKRALEEVIRAMTEEMDDLAGALIEGQTSLAAWQADMAGQIKTIHLIAGAVAVGGWAELMVSQRDLTGELLRRQYEFFSNFARQIESGAQALSRNLIRRARMYAGAARGTAENVHGKAMEARGFTEEMRVLGKADHCPDCLAWAGYWAPIGTLPAIGASVCKTNCHCTKRYRRADGTEAG